MASPAGAERRAGTVKAKVVLLGEGAVGKTSLVLRYSENKFNDKHEQTLQVRVFLNREPNRCTRYMYKGSMYIVISGCL